MKRDLTYHLTRTSSRPLPPAGHPLWDHPFGRRIRLAVQREMAARTATTPRPADENKDAAA